MSDRFSSLLTGVIGCALVCACAAREPIAANVCGNLVLEQGEDCDTTSVQNGLVCGAPHGAAACGYTCAVREDGTRPPCPSGWGCGLDDVCRAPSGTYVDTGIRRQGASSHLKVAELYGGGGAEVLAFASRDLLGTRPGVIVNMSPRGHTSGAQSTDDAIQLPRGFDTLVADVTGDGHGDVSVATERGIATLAGPSATLLNSPSLTFPSGSVVRAAAVDRTSSADAIVLVVEAAGQTNLVGVRGLATEALLAPLPAGIASLASDPVSATLDERATSPCKQVILAYRGSTEVLVATPCKPVGTGVGWDTSGDFTHVWFPDGAKVGSHGVVVGDVDLDGHLDLVIDTTLGLRVALGSGDGTFRPRHHEPGDDLDPVNTAGTLALPALLANETNILAMADIDADGFVDFVVPSGIVLSAHGDYKYVHEQRASRWTEAVIADFRRDGRNGVAAASDESGGIQFFTNAGGGHLNEADLRTNNFPQGLTVGDLDGDLFLDLAFVDVPEVQSTLFFSSEIEVAYGRPSSVPETPVSLGRIDQASQLIAGRFAPNPDDDLVDDLCLVGASSAIRDWSIMTDAVTVFAGDGDRNLTSPYVLRRRDDGVVASPIALAAGAFVDLRTNVLALASEASGGTDPVFRLWLQTLRFEAFAETKRVVSDPLPREIAIAVAGRAPAGLLAATKLDGTQRDTFLLVAPHADDPEGAGALVTGHVELSSGEPRIVLDPPQRFRGRVTPDSRLVLADLGGDGRLDALLVTGDVTAPGDLVVFWNDGTGHFDGAGALHFAPPGDVVQDVTCVPVAGGVGCQPIVLGLKTAYALSVGDAQALDAQRLDGVSGGTSIASGDITGDGVFDLAVGDGAGITVYSGVPVLP